MSTINPVNVPSAQQTPAFKGAKNSSNMKKLLEAAKDLKCPYSGQVLSPNEATIERLSGAAYAMKGRSSAELKETALRETMLGHLDFVKGINDVLAKNAAKDSYKPQ